MRKSVKKYVLVPLTIILLVGIIGSSAYANAKSESMAKEKTNIRLNDAKQDLLKAFTQFDISNDFKQINLYDGEKVEPYIAQEFDNLDQAPLGSTEPIFLMKKDASVLVILYKASDGTNVMRYAEKTKDGWTEYESKEAGKPILSFDEIKID